MTSHWSLIAVAAGLACSVSPVEAQTIRTLIATDGGTSSWGRTWENLGLPAIDPTGGIAFGATEHDGPNSTDYPGIWYATSGAAPALVFQYPGNSIQGTPAPWYFGLDTDGTVTIARQNSTTLRDELAIQTTAFATAGTPAVGLGGCPLYHSFAFLLRPTIRAGVVPFRGDTEHPPGQTCSGLTTSNDTAIWVFDGSVSLFAREGNQAIGVSTGQLWGDCILTYPPSVNDSGHLAFWNNLAGSGVTSSNDTALWGPDSTGATVVIAREGSSAPGTTDTINSFLDFDIDLNANDEVAFGLFVNNSSSGAGIWRGLAGTTLGAVVRDQDTAPGTADPGSPDRKFGTVFGSPVINAAGTIAFSATVNYGGSSSDMRTVWTVSPTGTLTLVAKQGQATPAGGVFGLIQPDVSINANGIVIFAGVVEFGPTNMPLGLWAYDPAANSCCRLRLIGREGETINPGGTSFTVDAIYAALGSGGEDGRRTCINDNNVVTFLMADSVTTGSPDGATYALYKTLVAFVNPCYADMNCDGVLSNADFSAFLSRYSAGEACANCDGSTTPPVLNTQDFNCFLNAYNAGCS
jgi:hypothetical protein